MKEENTIEKEFPTPSQILSNIPYHFFEIKIDKDQYFEMVELIVKEDSEGLKELISSNNINWKELCLFVCCIYSKKELILEFKNELEDFNPFLRISCLSGNVEMVEFFISWGADDWDESNLRAFKSRNKRVIDLIISKGKKKKKNFELKLFKN